MTDKKYDNAEAYDKDGIPIYGMDLELKKKIRCKKKMLEKKMK